MCGLHGGTDGKNSSPPSEFSTSASSPNSAGSAERTRVTIQLVRSSLRQVCALKTALLEEDGIEVQAWRVCFTALQQLAGEIPSTT
jgi:hypothetical protein